MFNVRVSWGIIFKNKLRRWATLFECVIDSTGDADIAASLGVPTQESGKKTCDTFQFRVTNVNFQETLSI